MTEYQLFPEVIDNTMLKDWRRCPRYFFHRHIMGLRPVDEGVSVDLHYGAALAKALETARRLFYVENAHAEDARQAARDAAIAYWHSEEYHSPRYTAKSLESLLQALESYFEEYPLTANGLVPAIGMRNNGIEMEFAIPLPINHPITRQPLRYAGRCDMVARDSVSGDLVIVDEKTASTFSEAWLANWTMDPQISGYLWMLRQGGLPEGVNTYAEIRGISPSVKSGVKHATVRVTRTPHQLEAWYRQTLRDTNYMMATWELSILENDWDLRLGNACTAYGRPCEYMRLCNTPDPEQFIQSGYEVKRWSPLTDGV